MAESVVERAGSSHKRNLSLTTEDIAILQNLGVDTTNLGTLSQTMLGARPKDNRYDSDASQSGFITFGPTQGTTAAGTVYEIPAYDTNLFNSTGYVDSSRFSDFGPLSSGWDTNSTSRGVRDYTNFVSAIKAEAEARDRTAELGAQTGAFQNIVDTSAANTEMFIDAETVSPDETEDLFSDLAEYTGTGGGARPEAGTGDFYDRTADQQQSTLDAYAGDTSQGVRMDPRLADATVQGQVQIRNDITGAVETLSAQSVTNAVSLLSGLGISTDDMLGPIVNADGTVSYQTAEGKDLSSLISNLGISLEARIGEVAGDVTGSLGYGGDGQDTLFSDIAGLGTAIGDVRGDIGGISTLDQQDVQRALTGQFGDLTTEIQTVGTAVGGVQTTVDDVETAVGVLDERQLQIVQDLAELGADTGTIIDALGRVEGAVGAGGTLEGQIASKASGIQQAVSGIGGQVSSGFGNQASQISGLEGGASATALSQVAGDLGDIQAGQDTQAETLGTLATVEGQQNLANTVAQVKTATEGVDAAIKTNVIPEFENIFDIFDDQGNLLSDVETATGNIKTSVDANGNVAIEKFSNIGDAIGNIDVSNMDESAAIKALTTTIGTAASTFTEDYSSMETNIAGDRATILKAIQDDSSALDTLIATEIPQTIETEFGTYEAKIGENDELLVTKIDQAVDLTTIESTVDDIKAGNIATLGELNDSEITALANAVNYDATSLLSSIEAASLSADDLTALSTLTSDDITNAVDLSGLSTLEASDVTGAVDASTIVSNINTVVGNIKSDALTDSDLDTLGELDASVISSLVDKVDEKVAGSIDREGLISRITQDALTATDLDNLALLTSQDVTDAVDLSGVATSAQVGQVGTAVQGQAVSLGNINNIKGDVTTLLAKAEEDLASNTARDSQISGVREDMLDALDDEINANEAVMRNLLAGQTQTIQGDLGDYVVSLDSQTGKLTAQAIDRQTLALGADIDAGTGQLIKDADTNTNYLERKVLEAKERVEGKIGTAFDTTGALISSGLTANGDEIERVLDAEGKLTETVISNGTVQDTIVTDLSSVLDETGNLNQAAIELAQQGSDIEQKQTYFNALGGLIREDVDTMGRRITREIDSSGQFIRETRYYADGSEAGTDTVASIQEILDKIFPSDPLAQPEELTAADRRFLQGFRAEGLMGFG